MPTLNDVMGRFGTLTAEGILPKHDMDARIALRRREDEVQEVAEILRGQRRNATKVPAEDLAAKLGVDVGVAIAAAVIARLDVSPSGKVGISIKKWRV